MDLDKGCGMKMRKRKAEKRSAVDAEGNVLFDYPVLSAKATISLLNIVINQNVWIMQRSEDTEKKQEIALELSILANCRDYLNTLPL